MSVALNNIKNKYIQNFPSEVPKKVIQGFIAATTIHLASGYARNVSLVKGAMAATATVIEAITRPILRAVFPQSPQMVSLIQVLMPKIIALSLATSLAPSIVIGYKVADSVEATAVILSIIAWFILNDGFEGGNTCYKGNTAVAEVCVF